MSRSTVDNFTPSRQAEIRALSELVVNKIAAGEIIHRSANVVKELVENCLDAGSTQITVSIADGGLRLIAIQVKFTYFTDDKDDGCGIEQADLEILCHRFTTSKLRQYEDLQTIGTFGFRGEALASVSHVAHLSVTTRRSDSQLAYRAEYLDGKLKDKPKACAGNLGTLIKVEDLFYNMPIRRKALKCTKEEYGKCLDVIAKYALHNPHAGFLLKRQNDQAATCTVDVRTTAGSSMEANLASLFGASVAKDALNFELEDAKLCYCAKGVISHPNYQGKKFNLILFINERLVDCDSLKKGLDLLTLQILPKGNRPFVYLSLKIKTENVDVNVHPTKSEVHFLHENLILKQIEEIVEKKLISCNESRTFYVQQILAPKSPMLGMDRNTSTTPVQGALSVPGSSNVKVYDHELVRTDSKKRRLEEFFGTSQLEPATSVKINFDPMEICADSVKNRISSDDVEMMEPPNVAQKPNRKTPNLENKRETRDLKLISVENLKQEIIEGASPALKAILREHSMVGTIDAHLALIQHETSLYLVDATQISEHFFYQLLLNRVGNFGMYRFTSSFDLSNLVALANEISASGESSKCRVQKIVEILCANASLLLDYFSLEIDAQNTTLKSIPDLLDGFLPQMEKLPDFLVKLAEQTDWLHEKPCLRSICWHVAKFYAIKREMCRGIWTSNIETTRMNWKSAIESVLFPALKTKTFSPPADLPQRGVFRKLTDLHDLYKVFERC